MAFSNKQGREYQSRRERGYRTTKFPKGYDKWGMPIICGLIDADGNERPNKWEVPAPRRPRPPCSEASRWR